MRFVRFVAPHISLSRLGGWVCVSFLVGIFLHSLWPYEPVSMLAISISLGIGLLGTLFLSSSSTLRIAALCFLCLTLGVWRFEVARPNLPYNLIPFSADGFSTVSSEYHTANHLDPRYWLNRMKRFWQTRSDQLLTQNESALLKGMLWGERSFTPSMKDGFRRAGLMHLVAVSGTNVTILVSLMTSVFISIGLRRKQAFWFMSLGLISFVCFVGFGAPVVRAAIMGWLVAFAPIIDRLPNIKRLLLVSAVIFVAWQPWSLLFDVSFALSFLATIGLVIWTPLFSNKLEKYLSSDLLRETVATTLAATIMTLPYSIWAFGQASVLGLFTNLIAVPLVPWIMAVGSVGLMIGTSWAILPVKGFLDVILWLGDWANKINVGVWQNVTISFWIVLGCYVCLFLGYKQAQKQQIKNRKSSSTD